MNHPDDPSLRAGAIPQAPPEPAPEAREIDYSAAHGTPLGPPPVPPTTPTAVAAGGDWLAAAHRLGDTARDTAERTLRGTGRGMGRLATRVGGDDAHPVRQRTATALARGGDYLARVSPDEARGDLEATIRRRPLAALLVGLGMGVALGLLGGRRRRP